MNNHPKINLHMHALLRHLKKSILAAILCLLIYQLPAQAQEHQDSPLYTAIKTRDSLLFDRAFNNCDIAVLDTLLSDDFEFYHDKGGITKTKADFITSIKNNICGISYRPRRELVQGSLEVYPLTQNGELYGAIQIGVHRFYAIEKDKPEYLTGHAKFTHVWILEQGHWKFLRGLSYDHQPGDVPAARP